MLAPEMDAMAPENLEIVKETELLARIDAFLDAANMTPTLFGQIACADDAVVKNIRRGQRVNCNRRAKIEAALRDGWAELIGRVVKNAPDEAFRTALAARLLSESLHQAG